MRVLITSDWHIRNSAPRSRKDEYVSEQWRKVDFVFSTAVQQKCSYILHCGDLTEYSPYPRFDWVCFNNLINCMYDLTGITIVAIAGQHDLYFHGNRERTPLYTLSNIDLPFVIANNEETFLYPNESDGNAHYLYGASYGTELKDIKPEISPSADKRILMLHTLVSNVDIWDGHVPFLTPHQLFETFPQFDLIATGDNHVGFVVERDGRWVVNCGSLMRSNISQVNHKPFVAIYDTDTNTVETIPIPIAPFDEVMRVEEKKRDDDKKEEMEAFINGLVRGEVEVTDFLTRLRAKMEKVDKDVFSVLEEAITRIKG
jgi:DNA repair protein SbcD/Mre11